MSITKEMEDKINKHIESIIKWFENNHFDGESIIINLRNTHKMIISSDGKTICYAKTVGETEWVNIKFLPTLTKLNLLEDWTYIKQEFIAAKKRIINQNQKIINLIDNFIA